MTDLKFYLADVEAIVEPIAVIPDLGGEPNNCFVLRERKHWSRDFERWLEEPHLEMEPDDLDVHAQNAGNWVDNEEGVNYNVDEGAEHEENQTDNSGDEE